IPKNRKRSFKYLGFKEELIPPSKNVNSVDTPPFIAELEVTKALEELGESPE
ncbi:hypothetical protein KI387_036157, partial [Taxus chinensis]